MPLSALHFVSSSRAWRFVGLARIRRRRLARMWVLLSVLVCSLLTLSMGSQVRADYLPKNKFETYRPGGQYPFWSSTWLPLDPRVHVDSQGIPFVKYREVSVYNPVTIAIFGLLAYNRFTESRSESDRRDFLRMAHWLRDHQNSDCGCWYYDFDFNYVSLDETILKPWISAMAQGLAISVMTRASVLTHDGDYLQAAARSLLPFHKDVKDGGIVRSFSLAASPGGSPNLVFFEEYPTEPAPSFTLNGFMFSLLGLYDLAEAGNPDAAELFREGMRTLVAGLPLFDLGNGTAYDLVHLTLPPRSVHRDSGYHLIHITLLNALGTATNDRTILWYRDHWNSYGSPLETEGIWFARLGYWIEGRHPVLGVVTLAFLFVLIPLTVRVARRFDISSRRGPEKIELGTSASPTALSPHELS
jgi:heparosan-N-sulfate-glucuronate 5-epimerase